VVYDTPVVVASFDSRALLGEAVATAATSATINISID
jgi:hypothetical protein